MAGASTHCQLRSQCLVSISENAKCHSLYEANSGHQVSRHWASGRCNFPAGSNRQLQEGNAFKCSSSQRQVGEQIVSSSVGGMRRLVGLERKQRPWKWPLTAPAIGCQKRLAQQRRLGSQPPISCVGVSDDAAAFEQPHPELGQTNSRLQPMFDPLSISDSTAEQSAKKRSQKQATTALKLGAAVCLALIIAARQPPNSSSFLSLSMSTTPQTGPSPLQSFHPLIQTAWTGLVTGVLHTMTGPDHLASLAPLTIGRSKVQSTLLGALWGAGHGTGQLLLGSIFLLFKVSCVFNLAM